MSKEQQVKEIIVCLEELKEDSTVPRNVKVKLENSATILKNETEEISIRVDKVLQDLDEISNDTNTQSYARSQIWNIVSMLESMKS
jgi:uncharacterized protein (UPF0147 family)